MLRAGGAGSRHEEMALSSFILPMTLAERDNHLHFFMKAQSKVKRGEVTLSPGHASRP